MQQCIEGYRKQDPVSQKKLPVEAGVPKYLVKCVLDPSANELHKAVGDLSLIAFYYLLQVGEYTTKGKRDNSKQTVQFKMEDVRFLQKTEGVGYDASQAMRLMTILVQPQVRH